jgi:hypothetical protein
MCVLKERLKIQKEQPEAEYRRTDNTMAKRKKDKWTNNDPRNNTHKAKD